MPPIFWLKTMKKITFVLIAFVFLAVLFFPCLFIRDMTGDVIVKPLIGEVNLRIRYIHSVQKTPVEEYLKVKTFGKIKLYETRYQSFGVGLPFLGSEGEFYQDGDFYVMDMEREFKSLILRVGQTTDLTLEVDGDVLPLYKTLPVGARVEILKKPYIIGKFFS